MMWVFPAAAAVVSAIFAALVAQQFIAKHRPHQLAWSLALLMFAIASFAAAMGMLGGWNSAWFRIYFLFGAIVNVPVLALGTIYLLGPRKLGHACALLVAAASVYAAGAVFSASLTSSALQVAGRIPRARDVVPESVLLIARYMSFAGFFVVVGGALWSAWRLARSRSEGLSRLATANILIAFGTTVVAGASGMASLKGAVGSTVFAIGLLVGVSLMFVGFLRTRPVAAAAQVASPASGASTPVTPSPPASGE